MTDVSRETSDRLAIFEQLLLKWTPRINLIAPSTESKVTERHINDSLQLLDQLEVPPAIWADIGSGGGLPGLVVAAALHERTNITMIESDARKCAFLRAAARAMGLANVEIINQRIEAAAPQNAEVVSARALAPLDRLLALVVRHLSPQGVALLPKGRGWKDEIAAAERDWQFHFDALPSRTDQDAVILKISKVSRA